MIYDPFQYPPNFELARYHKNCTIPGKPSKEVNQACPCCQQKPKNFVKQWWKRDITLDFKKFGGSVVTYFWLAKFYTIIIGLIICIYSIYLVICIEHYCVNNQKCTSLLGIKIVSNEDLVKIIRESGDENTLIRLFTLRGFVFIILLIANAMSLYIVSKFRYRHRKDPSIQHYSLLFKNVKITPQQLVIKLKKDFPQIQIKQAFLVKKLEPYYTLTNLRMEKYYSCLIEDDQKKKSKMINDLYKLDKNCQEQIDYFNNYGDRILIVVNTIFTKKQLFKKYKASFIERVKMFFDQKSEKNIYCQQCPSPQQIIWNNIGQIETQKFKFKIVSIAYLVLLVGGSYLVLSYCMRLVYYDQLPQPYKTIVINIILLFVVIVALTFRFIMNKLSQMRYPNTQTNRTLFIVLTTVLFHLIYYLIIPTFYFWQARASQQSSTLSLICNQQINFIIVQIILAGIDLMHFLWKKKQKKVQNQLKPIGCQKILHKNIEYPRFPIEFKLIILFKFWSLTIFFAFQVPFILLLTFIGLTFIYIKDKHSIYHYYRMQIINTNVQFKFLRVYTNFFSIYMLGIFYFTQHVEIQTWIAVPLTIIAIICQIFFFNNKQLAKQDMQEQILPLSYEQLQQKQMGYRKRYTQFVLNAENEGVNQKIKDFLIENGFKSLRTQNFSLSQQKIVNDDDE